MMRDALFRLIGLVQQREDIKDKMKDEVIRKLIGMCQEHAKWKTHSFFVNSRVSFLNLPQAFLSNTKGGFSLTCVDSSSIVCLFHCNGWRTLFLDRRVIQGVLRWTVQIHYMVGRADFFVGCAPSDRLHLYDADYLYFNGACCFHFCRDTQHALSSQLWGVKGNVCTVNSVLVPDNSSVAVEVDADARTLSFFVNKVRVPHCVSRLNVPVHLGITGGGRTGSSSFTSMSLIRLPCLTSASSPCKFWKCHAKKMKVED